MFDVRKVWITYVIQLCTAGHNDTSYIFIALPNMDGWAVTLGEKYENMPGSGR
jgi:hypothetical protein